MPWNRNEKQEWPTSGLDFSFFTSHFPSFYFSVLLIAVGNISHIVVQYHPLYRAIWLTLCGNMADIGFQYDACRDAQPVRLLIKPRVYTFQCWWNGRTSRTSLHAYHGILRRKMIEITAQNDWFQLIKSIQSVCKTAGFASQIALFYLIIWFLMVYKNIKYGFYS